MVGLFKQKNPGNLILLLAIGIVVKLPMFLTPHAAVVSQGDGKLYEALIRFLNPIAASTAIVFPLLTFTLLFSQAVMLTRFINDQRMISRATYLPGLCYMLVTSFRPEWNYFSAPLLINTILIFILSALFGIHNNPRAKTTIFNIGVAIGVGSFLFVSSVTFILWVFMALIVMRPFKITEWLTCLLGVTTPFYFYAIYIVIDGKWNWAEFLPHVSFGFPKLSQSLWLTGAVFLIMVQFLLGGYFVQENLRKLLINVRKVWSLLLLMLLTAMLLPFVNTSATYENWMMAFVPMAAFHACNFFYSRWRVVSAVIFWVSVCFIFGYQYYGPGW